MQKANGVFRAVGGFCALAEEAVLEPCDASSFAL